MGDVLIGGLVAALSSLLTLYLSQRGQARLARREEQRERIAWARDDAARSYEHRRAAYVDFVTQWRKHYQGAWNYHTFHYDEGPGPDFDWMDDLYETFVALQVFGTRSVTSAAEAAMQTLDNYGQNGKEIDYTKFDSLLEEIRQDLAIPESPGLPPQPANRTE